MAQVGDVSVSSDQPVAPTRGPRLDPDALATLEEQHAFLVRSLADLEREHEAGDVDEADYEGLKADYAQRAEMVRRLIDDGKTDFAAAKPARSWSRRVLVVLGVAVFAVVAGVLVAQASGQREPGDSITGGLPGAERSGEQVPACLGMFREGELLDALKCYDAVLEVDPEDVEALTYRGWLLVQATLVDRGLQSLDRAVEINPRYPDARAFRVIGLKAAGRPQEALAELDALEALGPPPVIRAMMGGQREELTAMLAASTTSTTAG